MAVPAAIVSLKERLRRREILRFSCATRSPLSKPQQQEEERTTYQVSTETSLASPRLSSDPALTAFAQLAAWRLNCRRAFISLVDSTVQHVLAEATRTISLYEKNVHAPNDELLLGIQSMSCEVGICPITMAAFVNGSDHWVDSDVTFADDTRVIISDLLAEPRTMSLPFLAGNTEYRYYVEVPLISPKGLVIGSICAIDNQPRSRNSDVDVRALQDIARLITSHLELIRLKEDYTRAERLMQGLGHFNQGQSSISRWIMDTPGQASKADEEDRLHQMQDGSQAPLTYNEFPVVDRPTRPSVVSDPTVTPSTQPVEYFGSRTEASSVTTISMPNGHSDAHSNTSSNSELDVTSTTSPSLSDEQAPKASSEDFETKEIEANASTVSASIRGAFSRASNLIRESMDLEATCFLEVSPDGRFHHHGRKSKAKPRQYGTVDGLTSDDLSSSSATYTNESDTSGNGSAPDSPHSNPETRRCKRLGFSTRFKSSVASSLMTKNALTLPESLLSKLTHRYPAGHVFKFDSFGIISSGDDVTKSQDSASSQKNPGRQKLANMVLKYFPNARSLIFMPLYDNEKQHLYAGFVGWTTDPTRALQKSEMVYISGFANSIMCEVMRLETLVLDKAKSDFMSSMSHELRSPLHGILAATQLLQESSLSSAQDELATMVDTCGRTLLDIMNNLLDHAKINHFTDTKNMTLPRKSKSGKHAQQETYNLIAHIDLATIVEETVASVAAGHSVKEQRMNQISSRWKKPPSTTSLDSTQGEGLVHKEQENRRPAVIVDIEHRDNWIFETEAGSWRRIVMNIVGNALKYTETGHVHVALAATESSVSKNRATKRRVVLTVSDTGQGISENYLKHRLFSPFAQEDNLSIGAGLGLSIVSQIVTSLRGDIRIESEVGAGTKVTITVPLAAVPPRPSVARSESDAVFKPVRALARAAETACFLGFDIYPSLDAAPSGTMSQQALTMLKLKESLVGLVTKWYDIDVVSNINNAAIVLIEESYATSLLKKDPRNAVFTMKHIVVSAYGTSGSRRSEWDGFDNYLAAPIGPVKFTRVLKTVLQHQSDLETAYLEKARHMGPSRKEDQTSTAKNVLPKHMLAVRTPSPAPSLSRHSSSPGTLRLLLVDDNDINLRILASLVRKLDILYITAGNGQEAVDRYISSVQQNMPIDYVFMDISMPVMDGLSSTRHIRAYEREVKMVSPTKIIALTGLASAQAQKEALASGVDLFFRKPVKLNVLRELLSKSDEELARTDEDLGDVQRQG